MKRLIAIVMLVGAMILSASLPITSAAPPGPGHKICTPGQNNVGGGPGASGPGDKAGAPLKPAPSCPGRR